MTDESDDQNPDENHDDLFGKEKIDYIAERNEILRDVPFSTVRKAWLIMSHILLDQGATVLDMGCGDGDLTFCMAALNPSCKFIGIDKSQKTVRTAQETHKLPNLEFKAGDIADDLFEPESIDAIVNSFTLHKVYSNARYNNRIVSDTLRKQFGMLKNNGIMYISDYAKPPPNEYVLIEMHDKDSHGEDLEDLSEADLLVWYSEHAQPKQTPGCGGFFLEELPPRFPKTRLFRLPYKWAYEFIMRKDNRKLWKDNLPYEYTFYTVDEFRDELRALGARMQYSAPHWDEDFIRDNFEGHFRLLKTNGDVIGDPATSFIAVARKQPERTSLNVHERRISQDEANILEVKTMRDQKDGSIVDVVTRGKELAEILPYRLDDEGRLYVYLHDGIVRGISNAVGRSGTNIDGREWSGHMVETISTDIKNVLSLGDFSATNSQKFIKDFIGLTTRKKALLEEGPKYYPDPNYIEERVHTYYAKVTDAQKTLIPKSRIMERNHFFEKGKIREFSAQNIIDAISVGLIPNARLELQILSLMQHTKTRSENWISKDIHIAKSKITQNFDLREFLRQAGNNDKRFKEVKGSAGQLRTVNSIFVEEGFSQGGSTGISSEHLDFVISDEKTINTAVILPITSNLKGDLYAGFNVKHMPVPQRFEGNGISLSVPQLNIPKEVTNLRMLKQFVAEKYGIAPHMVFKLGESYFNHVSITPHRIHPLAISAPTDLAKAPKTQFIPFYQFMLLAKSLSKEQHFLTTMIRAIRYMPSHIKLAAKQEVRKELDKIFEKTAPDWSPTPVHTASVQHNKFNKSATPKLKEGDEKPVLDKKAKERLELIKRLKNKLSIFEDDDGETSGSGSASSGSVERNEDDNKKRSQPALGFNQQDMKTIANFEKEITEIKEMLKEEKDTPPKPKPE